MVDQGISVLNRGLGPLKPRYAADGESQRRWYIGGGMAPLVLAFLITIPSCGYIEISQALQRDGHLLAKDEKSRWEALARLATTPLLCALINFVVQHIRHTTFWWDKKTARSYFCCDPLAKWPMGLAFLGLLRTAVLKGMSATIAGHFAFYLQCCMGLICLGLYYTLLDSINLVIKCMAQEQEAINDTAPVKKMQNLVRNVTRHGRNDRDAVYCFSHTNTVPAEVLMYVWWLYYAIGKMLGAGLAIALLMGVDNAVIYHALFGGIAFSAVTAGGFMFELGPNTLSLFRLSLNKPFYVGDLVTLNMNGAMDTAQTSIMGFVENITMMYVVIRNFEMKQTWIPHKAFNAMIIQNWTRRPSKTVLLNIGVSCRCSVQKVEQLVRFGKRWMQASKEIQQTNYQKCHITKTGNGYNIQIIFFPEIGVTHRGIRQKFLIAFMSAAERMQIPFVPLQIMNNFCEPSAAMDPAPNSKTQAMVVTADMCDDLLPDPNDRLPKGVGMGFREFPPNDPTLDGVAAQPQTTQQGKDRKESRRPTCVLPGPVSPIQLPMQMPMSVPLHIGMLDGEDTEEAAGDGLAAVGQLPAVVSRM